ncbi:MAG: glycosyltransferase [Promethearchaeota archaeon]
MLENAGIEVTQFVKDSKEIDKLAFWGKAAMLTRIPYNKKIYGELVSYVQKLKPDVAHIHNIFPLLSPAVYTALNHAAIPVVQTHHNFRMLCPNGLFFCNGAICEDCGTDFSASYRKKCVKRNKIISYLYAKSIEKGWKTGAFVNHITLHIALNRFFAKKLISKGIPYENIRICRNFVFNFADKVTSKKPYFLFLGRLSVEKGLFTLLEAAREIKYTVKIAGTGSLEEKIRQYIVRNNCTNIELLGFVSGKRKMELIEKSLALIIPSQWHENFPISAVEALSRGTPVIACQIGGLPEIVSHGRNGYLFQAGNKAELIILLERIASSPELCMRLAKRALNDAKEKLSSEGHLTLLVDIFNEAISKFQQK